MPAIGNDFQCFTVELASRAGVRAFRGVIPPGRLIAEHRHQWPSLTLQVLGSFSERHEGGVFRIEGPGAVFHPQGSFHASSIGRSGLETVSFHIDPAWARLAGITLDLHRPRAWIGGEVASAARRLAAAWMRAPPNLDLTLELTNFLSFAMRRDDSPRRPQWLERVLKRLEGDDPPATVGIAEELDLHPAWLNRAYRAVRGEGIQDTLRRRRVERAAILLRSSDAPASQVAIAAGFCDQSHMSRSMRAILGRTPLEVRREGCQLF